MVLSRFGGFEGEIRFSDVAFDDPPDGTLGCSRRARGHVLSLSQYRIVS